MRKAKTEKKEKLFRMNYSLFRAGAVKPLFFAFLAGNLFFLNCGDDGGGDPGGSSTSFSVAVLEDSITMPSGSQKSFTVNISKSGPGQIDSASLSFTKTANSQTPAQNQALENSVALRLETITITERNLSGPHTVTVVHTGRESGVLAVGVRLTAVLAGGAAPAIENDSIQITVEAAPALIPVPLRSRIYVDPVQNSEKTFTVILLKSGGPGEIAEAALSFTKTTDPQDENLENSITLTPAMIKITEENKEDEHTVTVEHTGTMQGELTVNIELSVKFAGENASSSKTSSIQIAVKDVGEVIVKDDQNSIRFPFIQVDSSTVINGREQGGIYQMKLEEAPNANETVTVQAAAPAGITVEPAALMFDSTNWDEYQSFTVNAADSAADTAEALEITHSVNDTSPERFQIYVPSIRIEVTKIQFEPVDPIDYVDTLIATGRTIPSDTNIARNDQTNNYVGAHYPFGMSFFTPMNSINFPRDGDTHGNGAAWTNYVNRQHRIKGFALADIPGPGCDLSGDFPLMMHLGDKKNKSLYSTDKTSVPADTLLPLYIKGNEPPQDNVKGTSRDEKQNYIRSSVKGKAGYYEVTLSNDLKVRLTVGKRTGIAEFHLPNTSAASKATLFFTTASRMPRFITRLESGSDTTSLAQSVRAMIYNKGFCQEHKSAHKIYMVGVFQQQPISAKPKILTRGSPSPSNKVDSGGNHYMQAAYVFNKPESSVIRVKYGLSYVSHAGAWENLQAEIPDWDFDKLKRETQTAWRDILNKVKVQVPDAAARKDDLTIFYSAMYRALSSPHIFSDTDGRYKGFNNTIYHTERLADDRRRIQYQYFSGWDTYRSQMQLVSLFDREISGDMIQSLVNNANQAGCQTNTDAGVRGVLSIENPTPESPDYGGCNGGGFTRWGVANDDSNIMDGQPGVMMAANALAFGVTDFNADSAFDIMVRSSQRLRTSNIKSGKGDNGAYTFLDLAGNKTKSNSLELAAAYFSKAVFARRLSKFKTESAFVQKYSFDPSQLIREASEYGSQASTFFSDNVKHFRLYQGDTNDNPPTDGTTTVGSSYQEGNVKQYTWMYPMNMAGTAESPLTRVFGWDGTDGTLAAAVAKAINGNPDENLDGLDTHLSKLNGGRLSDFIWMGNEPSHFTPFAYLFLDAANAYKSQGAVRRIQHELYKNEVNLALAGNDDLGAMSSWYVWTAIGFYPAIPSLGHYSIVTPLFDKILIDKDDGRGGSIFIQASNIPSGYSISNSNNYVQLIKDVKLNGMNHNKVYFQFLELYQNTKNSLVEFDLTQASTVSDAESETVQSQVKKDWELGPSFTAIDQIDSHL